VKVVFLRRGSSKVEEGETTSATLGSLEHGWPYAWIRVEQVLVFTR
jgi:hypothetical protein